MYDLTKKTEEMVETGKDLINQTAGDLFKTGVMDLFAIDADENSKTAMNMFIGYMDLSNKAFDLAIEQAKAMDEMQKKMDVINCKLNELLKRTEEK